MGSASSASRFACLWKARGAVFLALAAPVAVACNGLLGNEDGVFISADAGASKGGALSDGGIPDSFSPIPGDAQTADATDDAAVTDPDAGAACPASVVCASGKCVAGKCEPLVFVSMQTVAGNGFGAGDPGFAADQKCTDEGKLFQPLAQFFAWFGGTSTPTARQLRLVPRPYWTPGPSGQVRVADNAAALTAPLLQPIARRDGTAAQAPPWTNVTASGVLLTTTDTTCVGWTNGTAGGLGAIGDPVSLKAGDWAAHQPASTYQVGGCDALRPVLCFEDVTP
jgi:hypothetical protein